MYIYQIMSNNFGFIDIILLVLPGFISDTIGFLFLIPFSRKIIINIWLSSRYKEKSKNEENIIDAEIVEEEKKKDEL